jgi:hypothetical protein
MTGGHRATNLGLLKGLRVCRRYNWGPVHEVGDNNVVIRQHEKRTPPRRAVLKMPYWAARSTADAVGVASWRAHPRDCNRTVHSAMHVVLSTQQGMEWVAGMDDSVGERWAHVVAAVGTVTRRWMTEFEQKIVDTIADGTV